MEYTSNLPHSPLRGQPHDTKYKWLMFNPKVHHAGEQSIGNRISVVFFTPSRLHALEHDHWDQLKILDGNNQWFMIKTGCTAKKTDGAYDSAY
eukprot:618657-Amphidinium_carterae.2